MLACLFRGYALDGCLYDTQLVKIWTFVRCLAGEWILRNVVQVFPRTTFQRRACNRAYIKIVEAREKELGGFDP
jgi:Na+/glutamate symporter